MIKPPTEDDRGRLRSLGESVRQRPEAARYTAAVRDSRLLADYAAGRLALEWAPARLVADEPGKGLGNAGAADGAIRIERARHTRGIGDHILH